MQLESRHLAPPAEKAGWRVAEWAHAVGISRSAVYEGIRTGDIASVKYGGARIITTAPREFLGRLRDPRAAA